MTKFEDHVELGSAAEIPGVGIHREPSFFERGATNFKDTLREAANYKQLRKSPYGLKPIYFFLVLGVASGFDGSIFGLALPEIIRDLDIDLQSILAAQNLLGFFAIFAVLGLSWVADRTKRVPMLAVGALIAGVSSLLTARAGSVVSLGATRLVNDVGGDIVLSTPQASLGADYYSPEDRAKAIAFSSIVSRVVFLAAPLIIAYIVTGTSLGWRVPFMISGSLMILVGIAAIFVLKEPVRGYFERKAIGMTEEEALEPEEPVSFGEAWRTIWSILTLRRLFMSNIVSTVGDGIFAQLWFFFLLERYGLNITQRAWIGTLQAVVLLPFGFLAAGMIDVLLRRGPQRVLVFSGLLGVASSIVLFLRVLGPPLWVQIAFTIAFGIAGALLGPARGLLFINILPPHVRTLGGAVGLLSALPGTMIRFLVINFLLARYGIQGALMAAAPFILISSIIDLTAAPLYEADVRSAVASAAAGVEWRRAKKSGTGKLLVVRDVDVAYDGVQVLFGVDLDVEEGQLIALLGTNGAGKSTLLKAIAGTQEASSGAVVFDGRDTTHMPPHEIAGRGVILMPGGRGVFPNLSVRENLRLGAWLHDDSELDDVFETFPVLRDRLDDRATVLSGGEQQMLSLAQAFLARPKLLLIDELSLGLSPAVVTQLLEIVRRMRDRGTTIVMVEQSVNVALTVCERAVFMEKGEVRFVGETAELLRRPDILRAVYVKGTGALSDAPSGAVARGAVQRRRQEIAQSRPVLEVKGITKRYGGVHALTDVSFELRDGEVLGLVGPNGAGKTTVFEIISGYQSPDAGEVIFDGVDVTSLAPDERARRRLVRRFQDARLFPSLTVYENILVALDRSLDVRSFVLTAIQLPQVRQSERRVRQRAERLVELLELGSFRDKFARELSTGLRRIVDLACVLAANPRVLLLDEPSSGIAQAEAESLGPLLRRVRHEIGCSILIIEHDMPLITAVSDELIAMDQGQVVLRGIADDVLNDQRVVQSYLGTSEDVIQRSGAVTR